MKTRSYSFTLVSLVFFVLSVLAGCGLVGDSGEVAPQLQETWLSKMIRSVPAEIDYGYLMFANQRASREVAGATDFRGLDFADYSWLKDIPWTYEALPSNPMFDGYSQSAFETFGVNTLLFDYGMWSAFYGTPIPPFSITTGGLNDPSGLLARLSEAGYRSETHSGVEFAYFVHDDEFPVSLRVMTDHPLRGVLRNMNAVTTTGDRLMVAREVGTLQRVIDADAGDTASLWNEESWRMLTQVAGDELLAGVLISPDFVGSGQAIEASMVRTPSELRDDWKRYVVGPGEWGTLMPYTAAALGYGVQDGMERTVIALYHPDTQSAEHNAAELKRRWESAQLDVRRHSNSGPDIPFSEICGPLDTETVTHSNASILIASCAVVERNPVQVFGTTGRDFWQGLIWHHELHMHTLCRMWRS